MVVKRQLRGTAALKVKCKKYTKNNKSNDKFVAAIYLTYIKFLRRLMAQSMLNVHEKKDKRLQPEHIKALAIFQGYNR